MTVWNYRIIRTHHDRDGDTFEVAEVYYDQPGGKVTAWAVVPAGGDTVEELAADLGLMVVALGRDVIDAADLPGKRPTSAEVRERYR